MRILQVRLENDDYERFAAFAAKAGKEPEIAAAEALMAWTRGREKSLAEDDDGMKRRFIKLRLQDKDRLLGSIADELGVITDILARWDEQIRANPAEWSKAFVYASKNIDPLIWEMTIRSRFYDLWGHRPGSKGGA